MVERETRDDHHAHQKATHGRTLASQTADDRQTAIARARVKRMIPADGYAISADRPALARRDNQRKGQTMNRISYGDLDGMLKRLGRNMVTAQIITTESLCLEHGSKLNGNSYNVITYDDTAQCGRPFGTFHFGFTARDCYDRMHAMCVALETVPQDQS